MIMIMISITDHFAIALEVKSVKDGLPLFHHYCRAWPVRHRGHCVGSARENRFFCWWYFSKMFNMWSSKHLEMALVRALLMASWVVSQQSSLSGEEKEDSPESVIFRQRLEKKGKLTSTLSWWRHGHGLNSNVCWNYWIIVMSFRYTTTPAKPNLSPTLKNASRSHRHRMKKFAWNIRR